MNRTAIRFSLVAAAFAALIMAVMPHTASAQGCQVTVTNTTTCTVNVCMNNNCGLCPPGVTTIVSAPCAVLGNVITTDICGVPQQLLPGQCCNNVGVGVGLACCATVCLTQTGPGTYTLTVVPGGPVCHCVC